MVDVLLGGDMGYVKLTSDVKNIGCQTLDIRIGGAKPKMTYPTLFYVISIGLTYIASRHVFQHRIPYLHHIHDAIFSLSISYSAILDVESWVASGAAVTLVGGETHVSVHVFEPVLPTVYTVYALYKLTWERATLPMYEKMKYNVGLTVVSMYVLMGLQTWALAVIIYCAHGHVYVFDALFKAAQEVGVMLPYTYLRLRAILSMWVILPLTWSHIIMAILYNASWGVELWCFLGLCAYVLFESYIAVIDYGYNRALLRIQERRVVVDVEEIL
jgi:hypothetical protein